jgi:hypothetical protein
MSAHTHVSPQPFGGRAVHAVRGKHGEHVASYSRAVVLRSHCGIGVAAACADYDRKAPLLAERCQRRELSIPEGWLRHKVERGLLRTGPPNWNVVSKGPLRAETRSVWP